MNKDIVFVDTSVYIAEKYFAPNNRILALRNLAGSGIINVVSTIITDKEVLKHFKDDVTAAWNDVTNNHRSLICFDTVRPFFKKSTKKDLLKMCDAIFNDFQQKAQVYSIGFKYCSDVETIFQKYFKGEKPFNEGKKKHEFPDAFVLQMLEQYCQRNGLKNIVVLSADKDMTSYASPYLIITDYKQYLTDKQAEAKTLEKIRKSIHDERDRICEEIQVKLETELYDRWLYSNLFNTEGLPDVEVKECRVHMGDDFSIISRNQDNYLIELQLISHCEVKCSYVNLDYATYDREDGTWYGGEWEDEVLKGEESFSIIVSFEDCGGTELTVESLDISEAIPSFQHSWDNDY